MGLQDSPASFANLIDYYMCDLKGVLTYIKDVLCHARTYEEHLVILEQFFLRLCKYGLQRNISKSTFGSSQGICD